MEKEKINVLFDATILSANFNAMYGGRSGIYFAAFNILKNMIKNPELKVTLCDNNYNYYMLEKFLEHSAFEKCKIIEHNNVFIKILSILTALRYKNKRTADKKTQTLFMIITRISLKILINTLRFIYEKSPLKKNLEQTLLKDFDIYFSPVYKAPDFILANKQMKKYTLLYDLIPVLMPEYHPDKINTSWYSDLIKSLNKNDYYFAISENTRQDFLKHFPQLDENKVVTTFLAANEYFYRDEDKEKNLKIREKYNIPLNKKYIFSLCTLEPRKNLIFTIKNFIEFIKKNNINDLFFVLGGGQWEDFIGKLNKEIKNLGDYKEKIIKAGYVDDEDLASLYTNSEMFVYTSLYEGFGLPPLEAMQCGCPVITSNVSSLPEVVGDAAITINPSKNEELIEAYEKIYCDENLKKELSKKGLERAKEFSWGKCVSIIVKEMLKN